MKGEKGGCLTKKKVNYSESCQDKDGLLEKRGPSTCLPLYGGEVGRTNKHLAIVAMKDKKSRLGMGAGVQCLDPSEPE